jgi:hypothetical protein
MYRPLCAAAVLLAASQTRAAEPAPLLSGYRVNEPIGHIVCETVVTGPNAGKKMSLVCHYARRPVAMVFVRELSPAVVCLVKGLEEAIRDRPDVGLAAYVVLLCDDEGRRRDLAALAEREGLKHVVLALVVLDGDSNGVPRLRAKIGPEAAVTVVLASDLRVRASHAFRQGGLQEGGIAQALGDFARLVPKKD